MAADLRRAALEPMDPFLLTFLPTYSTEGSGPVPELVQTPSGERSNAVRKALTLGLTSAGRFAGFLMLLAFLALSSFALPILLLSLFWLD